MKQRSLMMSLLRPSRPFAWAIAALVAGSTACYDDPSSGDNLGTSAAAAVSSWRSKRIAW